MSQGNSRIVYKKNSYMYENALLEIKTVKNGTAEYYWTLYSDNGPLKSGYAISVRGAKKAAKRYIKGTRKDASNYSFYFYDGRWHKNKKGE